MADHRSLVQPFNEPVSKSSDTYSDPACFTIPIQQRSDSPRPHCNDENQPSGEPVQPPGDNDETNRKDPADPPDNGDPADPPDNGGPADPPDNGGPADPPENEDPADPPDNGDPADPPENRDPADPPENGDPADPPDNGGPADPPDNGGPADPPENEDPADPPENGGPADPPENGDPADPPENGDPHENIAVPAMPKAIPTSWWYKYRCGVLLLIIGGVSFVGLIIFSAGGTLIGLEQNYSSTMASRNIVYMNETVLISKFGRKTPYVFVQQDCSGGDHRIEFYSAPNCDLITRTYTLHSDPIFVNSTRNPTITEVQFSGQSHVYLVSNSFLDFMIEILSPTALVKLVVFDNYTYFTQYEHSSNPNTDKANLVHTFEGRNSTYPFKSKHTTTYFFALQSSENSIFNFGYNGTRIYYNFSDYTKLNCELPVGSCGSKVCQFEHSTDETCILAYTSVSPVSPTFSYIDTVMSESREHSWRNNGIIVAPFGASLIMVAIVICIVFLSCKYRRCCCNCTANNEERQHLLMN